MRRWILVFALGLLLPGCDVATAALIMGGGKKSSSDDGPPLVAPPLAARFTAYTAMIADPDMERVTLFNAFGVPSSTWTEIGNAAATDIFDPIADPTSFNAILIVVSSAVNYKIDSIEILDNENTVVEYASGQQYYNNVDFAPDMLGAPDVAAAETTATDTTRAFIFTLYTGPIERFRINVQSTTAPVLVPGDLKGVGAYPNISSVRPGGMAIDSNGIVHVTLSVGDQGYLVRYNLDGTRPPGPNEVVFSTDLATSGSHSVALNSSNVIFTSSSNTSGVIQLRRFEVADLSDGGTAGFTSGFAGDRVEHNSLAIDATGNVIVVGGFSSLLSGRNHFRAKLPDTLASITWQTAGSLDTSSSTYWHAVTTGPGDEIFMAGDLLSSLFGGTNQMYTGRFSAANVGTWDDSYPQGHIPFDLARAIALDGAGNIFVAGYVGPASGGRNGSILRYPYNGGTPGTPALLEFAGQAGLDDEIWDIAVDTDGAIYAVGFVTVAGQGEDWWVRKYTYDTVAGWVLAWDRTHHGGFGNDRATSVAVFGNSVAVAGFENDGTGTSVFVLRVYEK